MSKQTRSGTTYDHNTSRYDIRSPLKRRYDAICDATFDALVKTTIETSSTTRIEEYLLMDNDVVGEQLVNGVILMQSAGITSSIMDTVALPTVCRSIAGIAFSARYLLF